MRKRNKKYPIDIQFIKFLKNYKSLILLCCILVCSVVGESFIAVDPDKRYQTIEGWGGSLSWWANIAGGYTDEQIDSICTWITSPDGLNMNVFVFNIAGGENPDCPFGKSHMRVDAHIEGYKPTESGGYDWKRDANQRKILLKIKEKRSDCIFSACSYSPPYWMTHSGCSAGHKDGADNLKPSYYAPFADYLTEVIKYYHDSLKVTFRTISPMNEPMNSWWKAGGTQEGCAFLKSEQQSTLISEVYNKLISKNMIGYCKISAPEGCHTDQSAKAINDYIKIGSIDKIAQINTHTYGGNQSAQLKLLADKYTKRLWQSESGPLSVDLTGFDNNLFMAQRVITDMNVLKPVVWLDWQLLDKGDVWGLIKYDDKPVLTKTKNYYSRMHFSRFVKPGYIIIHNDNENTLTALNPEKKELIVVNVNSSNTHADYKLDLNLFGSVNPTAIHYRTDSSENCKKQSDIVIKNNILVFTSGSKSVHTFIIGVNLAASNPVLNGTYRIMAKHSKKYMSVSQSSDYNGANIEQWELNDQQNECFKLTNTTNGYIICPVYNNKPINICESSKKNGAIAIQWDDTEGANQRFSLIDIGAGEFKIVARHSAKCLAVLDNGLENGNKIVQWEWLDYENFKWKFISLSTNVTGKFTENQNSKWHYNFKRDRVIFNIKNNKSVKIEMFNLNGKRVCKEILGENDTYMQIDDFVNRGIYLIKIDGIEYKVAGKLLRF